MTANHTEPTPLEQALTTLKTDHEAALAQLEEARDAKLRDAIAQGYKQTDLVRLTGYTRETIRRATRPEVKTAAKQRRQAAG